MSFHCCRYTRVLIEKKCTQLANWYRMWYSSKRNKNKNVNEYNVKFRVNWTVNIRDIDCGCVKKDYCGKNENKIEGWKTG